MDTHAMEADLQIAEDAIHRCQDQLGPPPRPPRPPDPEPVEPILVYPGDDVQRLIDAAEPGAVLAFRPGEVYTVGTLMLAGKRITLQCEGAEREQSPLPRRRIMPADAPILPLLRSGGLQPTIDGTNATGVRLVGLHFESRSDGLSEVIIWQDAVGVDMDRILLVAGEQGQKRAIRGNGQWIILRRSHIANIWREGQDSQAFCAWDGAGPYAIVDNYLEAAGENIMFGGADSLSAERLPSNIRIERNTITKRDAWRERQGFYSVKNLFELKAARHVKVRFNHFSKNWTDAQNGFALLIKSVNQDGGAPWSVTEDVLFEGNVLTDTEGAVNVQGYNEQLGGQTTGIIFRHEDYECSGVGFQVGNEIGALTIEQCTIRNGYTFISMYADYETQPAAEWFSLRNVAANHNEYGIKGGGTGVGQPTLDRYITQLDWSDNLLDGGAGLGAYPETTYYSPDEVPDGVDIGNP